MWWTNSCALQLMRTLAPVPSTTLSQEVHRNGQISTGRETKEKLVYLTEHIILYQHQRWHSSSSSRTSWWQWNENWWSSYFFKKKLVVARSFTADSNLQPTVCVNIIPHKSHFLAFVRTHDSVARDIGSRWLSAARHPRFMNSVCSDVSSTLHFALFKVSLIFHFILLIFIFIFHVGRFGEKYPARFRE